MAEKETKGANEAAKESAAPAPKKGKGKLLIAFPQISLWLPNRMN